MPRRRRSAPTKTWSSCLSFLPCCCFRVQPGFRGFYETQWSGHDPGGGQAYVVASISNETVTSLPGKSGAGPFAPAGPPGVLDQPSPQAIVPADQGDAMIGVVCFQLSQNDRVIAHRVWQVLLEDPSRVSLEFWRRKESNANWPVGAKRLLKA